MYRRSLLLKKFKMPIGNNGYVVEEAATSTSARGASLDPLPVSLEEGEYLARATAAPAGGIIGLMGSALAAFGVGMFALTYGHHIFTPVRDAYSGAGDDDDDDD